MSRTLIRLLYTIFRKKAINRGGISASVSPRGKVFFASLPKRRKIPCFSRPKVVLLKRLAPLTRADYTREIFMERARISLNNGLEHGPEGRGFVRLNFGVTRAVLDLAVDRIEKMFR